jgi:hypothetical protein
LGCLSGGVARCPFWPYVSFCLEAVFSGGVLDNPLPSGLIYVPVGPLDGTVRQSGLFPEALAVVALAGIVTELVVSGQFQPYVDVVDISGLVDHAGAHGDGRRSDPSWRGRVFFLFVGLRGWAMPQRGSPLLRILAEDGGKYAEENNFSKHLGKDLGRKRPLG